MKNLYIQKTLQLIHFILIKILIHVLTNAIRIKIEFKCQLNVLYLKVINTDPPTLTLQNILQDILDICTTTLRYEIP